MTTATVGTGTITLGSAAAGSLTFDQAGVPNGQTVTYAIKDGASSEIGRGVYAASGTTLTRSVLYSTNSNNPISLSGTAEVFISAAAQDFYPHVNAQTGTSYAVLATDIGALVTLTNSAAIAVTLPQATGSFGVGWFAHFANIGTTTVTITPTTSTINGAASFILAPGQSITVFSDDTNYQVFRGQAIRTTEVTVASAATCDIGSAQSELVVVSGTTTITSFGTVANTLKFVRFSGVLTLTHNATTLILPSGENIVTTANDTAVFASDSSGNWRCVSFNYVSGYRARLSANRTYYVRTDGSDSNNGLANTSGGAFLTIQKAIDVALALDISIYAVTITIGAGTFAQNLVINGQGNTRITLSGAGTTTIIGAGSGVGIGINGACAITLQNLAIANGQSVSLWPRFGAQMYLAGTIRLGSATARQIGWDTGAYVQMTGGTIELDGNAPYLFYCGNYGTGSIGSGVTIATTAARTYTDVCYVETGKLALGASLTWNQTAGAITARKYNVIQNGVLVSPGTIPGGTAGVTATGGQYI